MLSVQFRIKLLKNNGKIKNKKPKQKKHYLQACDQQLCHPLFKDVMKS